MTDPIPSNWQTIQARIVRGHQVASGRNGDPRFPGGTLRMQMPHFRALGLELAAFYPGTLNVSIAPLRYRVARPRVTFRAVQWHPSEPAEDFSFFEVRLLRIDEPPVEGLIYHPHPETKPEHFQQADVLELLLPFVEGLPVGAELRLEVPPQQMLFEKAPSTPR
ncbi:MAG: hypothetical protein QOE70_588 [Chthoniobacter sp.]|jgi:hypothetical protein|nr:hypothetical protein [Chthoniobacter sp.]